MNATVQTPSARLSEATVSLPYDRAATTIGVVHFGPGAFHRAHQADVFDRALATDPRWAISAVALKSSVVRDKLAPQDGLYTLVEFAETPRHRVIGALHELLVSPVDHARIAARLVAPTTHLVTLTVTEKGYGFDASGALDLAHPDISVDLAEASFPTSVIGWIVEGLRLRRATGLPAFTTISCDNLAHNGDKLGAAVVRFAAQGDATLAAWIEANACFPNTMVDSITPATDAALIDHVRKLGRDDAWPVQRETFTQWVIEDAFSGPHPDWAPLGVTITTDVAPFAAAKLRLLNGAHSTLAYLGLALGYESVAEAMRDARLASRVEEMMRQDVAPTLSPSPGLDLPNYIDTILARFRNPSLPHRLAQIAWDGTQKLPVRLFGTIIDTVRAGRSIDRLCLPLAGWMRFIRDRACNGGGIVDPLADRLHAMGVACTGKPVQDVSLFLGLDAMFPRDFAESRAVWAGLVRAYAQLDLEERRVRA